MAHDEAMLRAATEPWLRIYSWRAPTVSIGFSQPLDVVPKNKRTWPVVRRWTGGGVVVHDGDWTYTLALPPDSDWCRVHAAETYRWIHEAMIAALDACALTGAVLQPLSVSDGMGVCFIEPAKFDVVWNGNKIAGAAQRRNKTGLLHQGSVQGIALPADFTQKFAQQLSVGVTIVNHAETEARFHNAAHHLATEKYGTSTWLHERQVTAPN